MHPCNFRRAVETGDLNRIMDQFADDAVLHSPITFQPFEGKTAIRQLLTIIMEVFQEFHYTDELDGADGTKALIFEAKVRNRDAQGIDLLRFNEAAQIVDLTVMVRPRSAMEALLAEVAPRLAAARQATSAS
jgi:hypothetical protein